MSRIFRKRPMIGKRMSLRVRLSWRMRLSRRKMRRSHQGESYNNQHESSWFKLGTKRKQSETGNAVAICSIFKIRTIDKKVMTKALHRSSQPLQLIGNLRRKYHSEGHPITTQTSTFDSITNIRPSS